MILTSGIPRTQEPIAWSLARCARIHGVTIREIAAHMKITLKRVREVRAMKLVPSITAWNFVVEMKAIRAAKLARAEAVAP